MKDWFKARNIWGAAILTLSDEEAGRFAKALWKFTMTGEQDELDGAEKGLMAIATMMLANDEEQSANLSAIRAEAGAKGAKQKIANQANANFAKTDEANEAIAPNKNKNKNKNIEKEHNNILAHSDELFDRFWAAYPRKTAKPDAKKAFLKLKPDDDLLQTMLDAIEKQKQTSQWQESGGQFIPYPASWLNGRRWEDEVQSKVSPIKPVVAQDYEQREYSEPVYSSPEDMIKRLNEEMGIQPQGRAI